MIGVAPIGTQAIGELDDEMTTAVVSTDAIQVLNAEPVIDGAAFLFLLVNPQARRRYLIEMFPLAV